MFGRRDVLDLQHGDSGSTIHLFEREIEIDVVFTNHDDLAGSP